MSQSLMLFWLIWVSCWPPKPETLSMSPRSSPARWPILRTTSDRVMFGYEADRGDLAGQQRLRAARVGGLHLEHDLGADGDAGLGQHQVPRVAEAQQER